MKLNEDDVNNTISLIPETEEDKRTLSKLLKFHDDSHSLVPRGHQYAIPDGASMPVTTGVVKNPSSVVYQVEKRNY